MGPGLLFLSYTEGPGTGDCGMPRIEYIHTSLTWIPCAVPFCCCGFFPPFLTSHLVNVEDCPPKKNYIISWPSKCPKTTHVCVQVTTPSSGRSFPVSNQQSTLLLKKKKKPNQNVTMALSNDKKKRFILIQRQIIDKQPYFGVSHSFSPSPIRFASPQLTI